jgi:transposase
MDRMLERCAGIDVHQATVMVTVRVPGPAGDRREITETFPTATDGLLTMREWLQAHGVTHVAMESTGVYWKPVYYVLEDGFTLLLVNTQHCEARDGTQDRRAG